ncbi:hypothetical protein Tco_1463242 [Tanacetum coccineum]
MDEYPELSNDSYVLYYRVKNPLAAQLGQKVRRDRGTRRGRPSTSSSTFDQPSSFHLNDDDDDENNEVPIFLNLILVCLDRLCHLAIFCLEQHAHTLHHLEILLTISLDKLNILKEDLEYQSLRKSLSLILELS